MPNLEYSQPLPKINHNASMLVRFCEEEVEETRRTRLLQQQIDALHGVRDHYQESDEQHVALVSMPTGSGKTGVIACLPYYLGTIKLPGSDIPRYRFDKPILVIAPNLAIRDQLKQELTVMDINSRPPFLLRTGIVPREQQNLVLPTPYIIKETSEVRNQELLQSFEIVIANAQKFQAADWEDQLDPELFRLVVVDEAHHHPATTWRRIVKKFRGSHCPVLFFTATPYRSDGQPVLPLESCTAYHLPLNTAVQQRIIRKTEFVELSEVFPDESFLSNPEMFGPEAKINMRRMIPILEKVKKLLDQKRTTTSYIPHMAIAIAKDIYYADRLLELWKASYRHERAETYHSEKTSNEKDEIMRKLKNNELSLVIVVAMLLEGFDHPPISIAAITYKIVSPVRFVQFIGRAQRIYRQDGYADDVTADIVTHKDYQQQQNYDNFINETLIPSDDEN